MLLENRPLREVVLECLEGPGVWTSADIADETGRASAGIQNVLGELVRLGLVKSGPIRGEGRRFGYTLAGGAKG